MAFVVRAGRLSSPLSRYLRPISFGRCISTSKKNDETAVATEKIPSQTTHGLNDVSVAAAAAAAAKKKWVSYGYNPNDEQEDVAAMHLFAFFGMTICIVLGAFTYMYSPDKTLRDWAHREAYFAIREREENGLPLLDPNYVDLSKIQLPTEEELADFEIII